jgi:branched-chain amino acid transport system substrate-binding protein
MISRREVLTAMGAGLGAAAFARGFPAIAQSRPLRIGALISQADAQGQDEMIQPYDQQMKLGLELAIAAVNAGGGILGRRVELLVADDDGSPAPGAAAALAMIKDQGAEALVSGFILAIRSYMDRALQREKLNIPVIHACQTEGTYCGGVAHVGSTTIQAITTLLQHLGKDSRQRTFHVSDWTPSQRTVSMQFYSMVQGAATGVALVTTPVTGNSAGEYRGIIRWAREVDARNLWISVPRPYAVNVVKQAYEIGAGSSFNYHFVDFSEWQASQLPEGATIWTSVPFVASDDNPAVRDFVARARRHSGNDLVTHVAFTHYNAIHAFKLAMEKAGTTAGDKVMAALDGMQLSTATGPVTMGRGRYATMPMYVARGTRGKLEVVRKFDAVATGISCA